MSESTAGQALVEMDEADLTHELASRPARAPDYAAENRALSTLAAELANNPRGVPQRLAELVQELCGAGSAGISALEHDGRQGGGSLRWIAATGAFAADAGATVACAGAAVACDGTACGDVVGSIDVMLLRGPPRSFPLLRGARPPVVETLLAPWSLGGKPAGTVWVASHAPGRRFDAEDARVLRSLAGFAAAAFQAELARESAEQARARMERDFAQRSAELQSANARLTEEAAQRAIAERELRESHAILDAAMQTETVGLAFYALDGRIIDCNAALERMSGYTRQELRTSTRWTDLTTPEFTEATLRALDELREGGRTRPYMKQLVRKDGSRWWGLVAPTCLPGEGGQRKCIAFVIDITGSRETEAALLASQERFRALVKGFAQAVWETDADGRIASDSPSWREFTGQTLSEWMDNGWANAVHPDDRGYALAQWQQALARGTQVNAEFRVRQANGCWRWSNVRAAPLRNPDGSVARWFGMNIDVDARRQAEAALRESDGRFRVLAEASPALIFQFDENGLMTYANRRCFDLLGLRTGATPDEGWGAPIDPADGVRFVDEVRTAIATRKPFQQRVRARAVDGRWLWFETHGAPLFGSSGAYRGHVAIGIDVTEAVQAEEALRDADRRKDEFLATLAHELRNPLAPISNAVHLLRRPDGRRTADRMVEMVGRQVRQIVRLVDDLMDVSRITQGKLELRKEPLSLTEVLSMAVETSMTAIDAGRHELTVSLPEETLMLDADKVRMTQVFSNMLNNAARYTDRGGRIWLKAWREGPMVAVSVRDNGIGIPAAKLPTVFEMFSQAHRDSARGQAGLGIGLTMVRSLIEMHGGRVEAHSDGPGTGTEFLVRLPLLVAPGPAPACPAALDEAPPLEGRRVLVVDDNGDAAESLALLLHCTGAEVRTANDGPAALAAAAGFAPHAVLLDLGMPGMDGFEVARRLRADPARAGLLIIALTGWGQEEDRRRTRDGGFDHHLTKPVDIEQLLGLLIQAKPG